jgi:hypothetical protein
MDTDFFIRFLPLLQWIRFLKPIFPTAMKHRESTAAAGSETPLFPSSLLSSSLSRAARSVHPRAGGAREEIEKNVGHYAPTPGMRFHHRYLVSAITPFETDEWRSP